MDSCFKCLPLPFLSWTLLPTLPYWRLDSNQRFKLTATGIDGISIHWYVSILVAGEGLEPPSSAYETELETTSSLTRYVVVTEGLEPPTGGDPTRLMRPTLHLRHNVCGEGMESNHRHKTFQIFALPTELPHHIWGWEPLCCLKSDTHLLSDSLLGQITFPFSREQHKLEIVLEYPSRSNLNCLIVVLRGLGRKGDEFLIHPGLSTSIGWGKPLSTSL